jgi:hypothetical protein
MAQAGRQVLGQVAPLAAGAPEGEEGIAPFAITVLAPASSGGGLGKTI